MATKKAPPGPNSRGVDMIGPTASLVLIALIGAFVESNRTKPFVLEEDDGFRSIGEVTALLDLPRENVKYHLESLEDRGLVKSSTQNPARFKPTLFPVGAP